MENAMHRAEWKAFHHAIRHDAWAFRETHGGYPSFTRRLIHNGEEWSFTRVRNDGARWLSYLRKSLIRQRVWRENHASEMNDLPHWHRKLRREPWTRVACHRAIRVAVRCAREWRTAAPAES
jgi:hypothetical protein